MLKIGEFSSLVKVSIRTLRHYDEVGLLRPAHVDRDSGYRYYSVSQLPRLYRILALRDLGFPLEGIAEAVDDGISAEALRGMLLLRQVEQQRQVEEEAERLHRLQAVLSLIEKEGRLPNDVVLKDLEPQWIVSLREHIPAYRLVGQLIGKLHGLLGPLAGEGMGVGLLHDPEYQEENVEVEAGVYLEQPAEVKPPLCCYQLPALTVASVVHRGAFNALAKPIWTCSDGSKPMAIT